jgi:AcrR family transcriptional regulator
MTAISRKERDKRLRKNDIMKAAVHVFAVKGYQNTTMLDIAKQAEYAVGTLYLYFKDKQSLYLCLVEEKVNDLISTVKKQVDEVVCPYGKLKTLVETQLAYFQSNADFFHIYFSERNATRWTIKDKISREAVNNFIKYIDYISTLISNAQAKGHIKKNLPAKRIAYFLTGMMNSTIILCLKNTTAKNRDIVAESDFILDVFLNGVRGESKRAIGPKCDK